MPNPTHNPWTDEDERVLAQAYTEWPVVYPPELLARHSHGSCQKRAYERKITRRRNVPSLFGHVTDTEWAYLAGIIDGEGTISFYVPGKRAKEGWTNRMVNFSNTDRALVDWALELFPGGGINTYPIKEGLRNKELYQVRWTRTAVMAELLKGVLPYLIVKKEKAMQLLENLPVKFSALT